MANSTSIENRVPQGSVAPGQGESDEAMIAHGILDQLITDSKLYTQSKDYFDLLFFIEKMRNIAPFNAMLLHIQKPGLSYAASARDWYERFGRTIKEGARPLLILWPFGPVSFLYDVLDTEGDELPQNVSAFYARGNIDESTMNDCLRWCRKAGIAIEPLDQGDNAAGYIRVAQVESKDEPARYTMRINQNHSITVQFTTLAHELGHLYLGHLGSDHAKKIPNRRGLTMKQEEFEAESVAYLVSIRNGAEPSSHSYLSQHVDADTALAQFDLYSILRAVGHVESFLRLNAPVVSNKVNGKKAATMVEGAASTPVTSANTIFTEEAANRARETLRAKLKGTAAKVPNLGDIPATTPPLSLTEIPVNNTATTQPSKTPEMPLNGKTHSADLRPTDQPDDLLDGGLKIAPSLPGDQRVSEETMQWLAQRRLESR